MIYYLIVTFHRRKYIFSRDIYCTKMAFLKESVEKNVIYRTFHTFVKKKKSVLFIIGVALTQHSDFFHFDRKTFHTSARLQIAPQFFARVIFLNSFQLLEKHHRTLWCPQSTYCLNSVTGRHVNYVPNSLRNNDESIMLTVWGL